VVDRVRVRLRRQRRVAGAEAGPAGFQHVQWHIAWHPNGEAFYVSGGRDDNAHFFVQRGASECGDGRRRHVDTLTNSADRQKLIRFLLSIEARTTIIP
jgi:hypothetical protein